MLVYRFSVVASCLKNGVPLEKIDGLRAVFERAELPLCHSSNLRSFVPKIEEQEIKLLREELPGQLITITFDGTTRLGEIVCVCARYTAPDFSCVHKRLLAAKTVATHMSGDDLSRFLASVLLRTLCMYRWRKCCWHCS